MYPCSFGTITSVPGGIWPCHTQPTHIFSSRLFMRVGSMLLAEGMKKFEINRSHIRWQSGRPFRDKNGYFSIFFVCYERMRSLLLPKSLVNHGGVWSLGVFCSWLWETAYRTWNESEAITIAFWSLVSETCGVFALPHTKNSHICSQESVLWFTGFCRLCSLFRWNASESTKPGHQNVCAALR